MRISVRVIPRSSKNLLEWEERKEQDKMGELQGPVGLKARLTAPPVDGAANEALIALLADKLALPRRNISIVRGATSRQKIVEITGITLTEIATKIPTSTR
jgi:hypothetical protein